MFGHLIRKFYLSMDQEMQIYFMVNPDLLGNEQGLQYGNAVYFLLILGKGKKKVYIFFFLFLV